MEANLSEQLFFQEVECYGGNNDVETMDCLKSEDVCKKEEIIDEKEYRSDLRRVYKDVPERRLPWVLFQNPQQLTHKQRANILLAYNNQLSKIYYEKARMSCDFSKWDISVIKNNCIKKDNRVTRIANKLDTNRNVIKDIKQRDEDCYKQNGAANENNSEINSFSSNNRRSSKRLKISRNL